MLILIYYSVRYLKSNLADPKDAATFLDKVYDCYSLYKNRIIVGQEKATIMKKGKLVYTHVAFPDDFEISFENPALDGLISNLLSCFKQYYAEWNKPLFASLSPKSPQPPDTDREGSPSPPPRKVAKLELSPDEAVDPQAATPDVSTTLDDLRPSHSMVVNWFVGAVESVWLFQKNVGDRVALANYRSTFVIEPIVLPGGVRPGEEIPDDSDDL